MTRAAPIAELRHRAVNIVVAGDVLRLDLVRSSVQLPEAPAVEVLTKRELIEPATVVTAMTSTILGVIVATLVGVSATTAVDVTRRVSVGVGAAVVAMIVAIAAAGEMSTPEERSVQG